MSDTEAWTADQLAQLLGERRLFIEKCIEALRVFANVADGAEEWLTDKRYSHAPLFGYLGKNFSLDDLRRARDILSEFEKKGAGECPQPFDKEPS